MAALVVGAVVVPLQPAGTPAALAQPAARTCVWRVTQLPTGGDSSGEVRGSDGRDRWVGVVSSGAAVWRHGRLTTLGPGRANDVNRSGLVVGADQLATNQGHAVLWRSGRRIKLAEPAGVTRSMAVAVNDRGLIVGWASFNTDDDWIRTGVGLVWSARTPWKVTTVTYRDLDVVLTDVSDDDLLVGIAQRPMTEEGPRIALAGTVRGGLRPLAPHETSSAAYATAGRYVIGETLAGGAVWRLGSRQVVRLPAGLMPTDVNRSGLVAVLDTTSYVPAVWTRSSVTALPLPRGWSHAFAGVVNDAGQLAGALTGPGPDGPPVVWSCSR